MLTQAQLKEILHYDPETGIFTWIKQNRNDLLGKPAGCLCAKKDNPTYLLIHIGKRIYRVHRLAWLYMTGEFPEGPVDHKDGNGLNNRFANLRACTTRQNVQNSALRKNNTSGYKNVHWSRDINKWIVSFTENRKCKTYGYFENLEEAAERARQVRIELHGEFARHS